MHRIDRIFFYDSVRMHIVNGKSVIFNIDTQDVQDFSLLVRADACCQWKSVIFNIDTQDVQDYNMCFYPRV